ncbi:UNVERIFIED_CONTAM: hypothetical protein K2H54_020192 [Gekko kuhli]
MLTAPQSHRHDGPPAALLEPPQEVRAGVPLMPGVLEPPRRDPQVRAQHVPPVLPPVRPRHRLRQDGLSAWTRTRPPPAESGDPGSGGRPRMGVGAWLELCRTPPRPPSRTRPSMQTK